MYYVCTAVKEVKRQRKEAKLIKQLEKQKEQEAAEREKLEEQQNKNGNTIILFHTVVFLICSRQYEEADVMFSMSSQVGRTLSVWPCLGLSWIMLSPLSCGPTWQDRLHVLASYFVSTRLLCLMNKESGSSR